MMQTDLDVLIWLIHTQALQIDLEELLCQCRMIIHGS